MAWKRDDSMPQTGWNESKLRFCFPRYMGNTWAANTWVI